MIKIEVYAKNSSGKEYLPFNDNARRFFAATGIKTLNPNQLRDLTKLGINFQIKLEVNKNG